MLFINNKNKFFCIPLLCMGIFFLEACQKDHPFDKGFFKEKLSEMNIFVGDLADLSPQAAYQPYEVSAELFSDYSEKQRLIKLPTGKQLTKTIAALPSFPDETILVKTFYYWKDQRDPSKGKKVMETRLLWLKEQQWQTAVYQWNEAQTEAHLLSSGANITLHWIDQDGAPKAASYHIPNLQECQTCHQFMDKMLPIGFTLNNLNRLVSKAGQDINQWTYFQQNNWINNFDVQSIPTLPNYKDGSLPLETRSRSYMDINCAHCHSPTGSSRNIDLDLRYHIPIEQTGISSRKAKMIDQMNTGFMPLLGTNFVDKKHIDQTIQYINSL